MRYQFTKTDSRYDGKLIYKTTYYPSIPVDSEDTYIISNSEDYLDSLAYKYYGDESLWWIIAKANNMGNGRLSVEAGKQIRIPKNVTKIIQDLNNLNK